MAINKELLDMETNTLLEIGKAYDAFVKNVENGWDLYFKTHGAQLITRADVLVFGSIISTKKKKQVEQQLEAAIQKYIDSHVKWLETMLAKIDIASNDVFIGELARQNDMTYSEAEKAWSISEINALQRKGINGPLIFSENWAVNRMKAGLGARLMGTDKPPILSGEPSLLTILLNYGPLLKISLINPAVVFLMSKKAIIDYLQRSRTLFLEECKSMLDLCFECFQDLIAKKE